MRTARLFIVMLISGLVAFSGCSHSVERRVTPAEMEGNSWEPILSATLVDGSIVTFTTAGARCRWVSGATGNVLTIQGPTAQGNEVTIPMSNVAEAQVRRTGSNTAGTVAVVVAVAGATLMFLYVSFVSALRAH